MIDVCYGNLLTILDSGYFEQGLFSDKKVTINQTLMKFYNPKYQRGTESTENTYESKLCSCERDIRSEVLKGFDSVSNDELQTRAEKLAENIPSGLWNELGFLFIKWFQQDDGIPDDAIVFEKPEATKIALPSCHLPFETILLNVMIYVGLKTTNKGKSGGKKIKKELGDFIKNTKQAFKQISVSPISRPTNVSMTLKGKKFNQIFQRAASRPLKAGNPNCLEIYHLDIVHNSFSYEELSNFLLTNIGGYIYSRSRYLRFYTDEEEAKISYEAIKKYLQTTEITEQELGNLLLFSFLEKILNAPKLFTKYEIDHLNENIVASGIHIANVLDRNGIPTRQFILGTSRIDDDLKTALDYAFDKIAEIKSSSKQSIDILSNLNYLDYANEEDAKAIKAFILPSQYGGTSKPDPAYGVFISYSAGIDQIPFHSQAEFVLAVMNKMKEDANSLLPYADNLIQKKWLTDSSIYIYLLPLNNALKDAKKIICDLVGKDKK